MEREFYVELLGEKNTAEIFDYMKKDYVLNDGGYLSYRNANINMSDYYHPRKIRGRICNFREEYIYLKSMNKEVIGMVTISVDYNSLVLIINMIHINKNYFDSLKDGFRQIIDIVKNSLVFSPSKIRVVLEDDNCDIWKDVFITTGFEKESNRMQGDNFEKNYTDYIMFL